MVSDRQRDKPGQQRRDRKRQAPSSIVHEGHLTKKMKTPRSATEVNRPLEGRHQKKTPLRDIHPKSIRASESFSGGRLQNFLEVWKRGGGAIKHPKYNQGLPHSLRETTPTHTFPFKNPEEIHYKIIGFGNSFASPSESSRGDHVRVWLPVNHVPSSKAQQQNSSYNQPQRPKRIFDTQEVSSYKPFQSTSVSTKRRLPVKNRSTSSLLSRSCSRPSPKIPLNSPSRGRLYGYNDRANGTRGRPRSLRSRQLVVHERGG